MIRTRPVFSVLICVLAAGLAACGVGAGGTGSKNYVSGGTLNYRLPSDWKDFQVQTTADQTTQTVLANNYATLLAQDKDGRLQPYLASSWKATPTAVDFVIKDGITCSDGTPVTPSVVAASLQHMIDIKAPYNRILFGPGPYKVQADDNAKTVRFETATPYAPLEYAFGDRFPSSMTGIICPAGLRPGADLVNQMYGAGPYTLVSANHGDQITMALRDDFAWGPGGLTAKTPGVAKQLVFKVVTNETTATNLLTSGGLDVAQISGPDVPRIFNDPTISKVGLDAFVATTVTFNETPGHPTTDPALRQAMITAIDPQAWVTSVYQGRAKAATSLFSETTDCFDPKTKQLAPPASVDAAKQVLQQAGYTGVGRQLAKDGQPVTVRWNSTTQMDPGPEYVANQWRQLGINVVSQDLDFQNWATNVQKGNYDASVVQTSSPGPTPGPGSSRFMGPLPPTGTNFAWNVDPVLNQAQASALTKVGPEACADWNKVQEQLWAGWHVRPMVFPTLYTFGHGWDLAAGGTPIQVRKQG